MRLPVDCAHDKGFFENCHWNFAMAVTRVFAHRGAAQEFPENTCGAFADALRRGADGIELDVRRSRDGGLVVHHDAEIAGLGRISECEVADLPREVPLLDAALEVCRGMTVNIEMKNDPSEVAYEPPDRFAAEVIGAALDVLPLEDLVISSFDLPTLEAVRRFQPDIQVGWLLPFGSDVTGLLSRALDHGFTGLHPFVLNVSQEVVSAAHAAGLSIATWTVNAAHDLERMVEIGVDVVITDDVLLARSVVDRREQP